MSNFGFSTCTRVLFSPPHPMDKLYSHPGHPHFLTSKILRELQLGISKQARYLCCLKCRQTIPDIPLEGIWRHATKCSPGSGGVERCKLFKEHFQALKDAKDFAFYPRFTELVDEKEVPCIPGLSEIICSSTGKVWGCPHCCFASRASAQAVKKHAKRYHLNVDWVDLRSGIFYIQQPGGSKSFKTWCIVGPVPNDFSPPSIDSDNPILPSATALTSIELLTSLTSEETRRLLHNLAPKTSSQTPQFLLRTGWLKYFAQRKLQPADVYATLDRKSFPKLHFIVLEYFTRSMSHAMALPEYWKRRLNTISTKF